MDAQNFPGLAEFLDKQAIMAVQDRYWVGLCRHDVEMVVSCFTEDAVYGLNQGHAQIRLHLQTVHNLHDITMLRGAGTIEINGDTATSETLALGVVTIGEAEPRRVLVQGCHYFDAFLRTPEGWRLQIRKGKISPGRVHDLPWQFESVSLPGNAIPATTCP